MEERIERSIADLEAANRDLSEFLGSVTEEQWRAAGSNEGWPVSALAYHIAEGYRIHMLWLEHLRLGQEVPGTSEELDDANARTAEDAVGLSPETVQRAVETGGRLLVAYLRGLGSEEIDRSAPHGPLGGDEMSVADMLEIAPWHVREHLDSMRSAVSRQEGSGT
jgi:hypothetical protein